MRRTTQSTVQIDTKPSVASIPDRVALTNDRLYTRARLLTLAKQHKISTTQQSRTLIIEALLEKRQHLNARSQDAHETVTNPPTQGLIPESSQGPSPEISDESHIPHTPKKVEAPITPPAPRAQRIRSEASVDLTPLSGDVEAPATTPINISGNFQTSAIMRARNEHIPESGSNGRSYKGGHFLHHRRRFEMPLRGLTPSPASSPGSVPAAAAHPHEEQASTSNTPPSVTTRRKHRSRVHTPPPEGARRFTALEPLSEEEDTFEAQYVSLLLVKQPEVCPKRSSFGSCLEERDEAKNTATNVLSIEDVQREEPLWNATGGVNLNAVPRVVKGGWNWDDITDLLRSSDFR